MPGWLQRNGYWLLLFLTFAVHLHSFEVFQRPLLALDDKTFVLPLKNMSLQTYINEWLPGNDRYAFPLRDFTFWLDFRLSEWFGLQTFWLTNLVFFALALYYLHRSFTLLFPQKPKLCLVLLAIVALHPINVEVLQWVYIRKHLMPALFVAIASSQVIALSQTGKTPNFKQWALWLFLYVLSLMCFPAAILWIFWPLWVFRSDLLKNKGKAILSGLGGLVLAGGCYWLVVANNPDYAKAAANWFGGKDFLDVLDLAARSLGRGFFNIILPIQLAPYYDAHSSFNVFGFLLLCCVAFAVGFLAWNNRSKAMRTLHQSVDLYVLGLLLFVPNLFVVLNFHGFVWADRYLFACFPYLLAGVFLWLFPLIEKKKQPLSKDIGSRGLVIGSLLALALGILSAIEVHAWKNDFTLMHRCTVREKSTKCIILSMEAGFEKGGCDGLLEYVPQGEEIYLSRPLKYNRVYRLHFPFYTGLCIPLSQKMGRQQKLQRMQDLAQKYPNPAALSFGQVILALQSKDIGGAYEIAKSSFLQASGVLNLTYKTASFYRGQAQAICALLPEAEKPECHIRLEALVRATAHYYPRKDLVEWARKQSLVSFRGKL